MTGSRLAFTRHGRGEPLVLLHGIGGSHRAWDPVVPSLAERFDVVAVDLPGHGDSPPLPDATEPHPAALAAVVAALLDDLDIVRPHVAGNSLGGWVALELADVRPLASLALLSPAGLWRDRTPRYARVSVRTIRWLAVRGVSPLSHLARHRVARLFMFGQTHGRPARMTPDYARGALRDMATAPGFDAVMRATVQRCYRADRAFDAPVTVAFGSRDRVLLPRQSRNLDQLPPGVHVEQLPGCGHVPMADDPAAVAALVVTAASRASRPSREPTG